MCDMAKEDPITGEPLYKEIDLIEGCINRMAGNSFKIKEWTVAIITAVVALLSSKEVSLHAICLIALIPLILFWCLDAFYLRTERKYRKMYEWVLCQRKKGNNDFQFELNTQRFDSDVDGLCKVMFSKTLRLFYGIPTLFCVIIVLIPIFVCNVPWL